MFRSFSAQSDPTIEISSCTSWQYCRTYYGRLDFPTSPTITGVRGAADGRQPVAAKPLCIHPVPSFKKKNPLLVVVYCLVPSRKNIDTTHRHSQSLSRPVPSRPAQPSNYLFLVRLKKKALFTAVPRSIIFRRTCQTSPVPSHLEYSLTTRKKLPQSFMIDENFIITYAYGRETTRSTRRKDMTMLWCPPLLLPVYS